jgi:hypothetical protein
LDLRGINWQEAVENCTLKSFEICTPANFRMIQSGRKGLAGHVACMRRMRNTYKILARKPEEKKVRVLGTPAEDGGGG